MVITPAFAEVSATSSNCLRLDEFSNWRAPDDRTVIITDSRHQNYKLSLIGTCNNLRFHESIAIKTTFNSRLSCVSPGDTLVSRGFGGVDRGVCGITKVEPYTVEMEKADLAAAAAAKAARDQH